MVNKVDQETFDMRSIVVLISHDHDWPIPKWLDIVVFLTHLQPHYLGQVSDLSIFWNLLGCCFSHIQKFTSQWEDTILISTNHLDTSECKGFCWVTLCQDYCALVGILGSSPICVVKLRDIVQFSFLSPTDRFTHLCFLFRLSNFENQINDTTVKHFFHELFWKLICAAEVFSFGIAGFFGLTVKSWVNNQTVYKKGEVLLDLVRFDVELLFVFSTQLFLNFSYYLIDDVLDVCAALWCADWIDKGNLLEWTITQTTDNLPSVAWRLRNPG